MATGIFNPPKKKTNLPYGDPNNPYGILPLNPPPPASSGSNANPNVKLTQPELTPLQKEAQGQQTPLQLDTNTLARKLVADPTQGMPENYANIQEEDLRKQNQQAYETARQGMAPAAGSAIDQRALLSAALTNVEGERKFRSDLDQQLALMRQQATQGALSSANTTSSTEGNLRSQAIQNMIAQRESESGLKTADLNRIFAEYEKINEQDPNAAFQYLQQKLPGTRMQFTTGQQRARQALADEYDAQKYQYAQIHSHDTNLVDPTTGELTDLGVKQFNEYMTKETLGETGPTYQNLITGKANIADLRGGADPASPNNSYYKAVATKATPFAPSYAFGGENPTNGKAMNVFKEQPPAPNSIVNYKGKVYQITSPTQTRYTENAQYQFVTAIDVNSGQQVQIP